MDLSIIIPVKNSDDLMIGCLTSVRANLLDGVQVIIVSPSYSANFKKLINLTKLSLKAMGKEKFEGLSPAEKKYRQVSRKRTVAKSKINKGEVISKKNIIFKRSDKGIDPLNIEKFYGKKSKKIIQQDFPILEKDLF